MKTKWIFGIVAVIMILSIFSISQGADRFYYGSWNGEEFASVLKDSLKFNMVRSDHSDASEIDTLAAHGMRVIVNNRENTSPGYWSDRSHYTMWEAEGLEQSWVNLQHNGGTEVNDPSASGGEAMRFSGPGTPGIIQTGPTYYQEPKLSGDFIKYTAEFRLKYMLYTPRGPRAPGPPPTTKVCSLMVVDRGTILKDTTLYKRDFADAVGYKTFELENYTVPDDKYNSTEFKIYWFGISGDLYIDYVKVYDEWGEWLMSGAWDSAIMDYVSQDWVTTPIQGTGEPVVHRWYMRDEPGTLDLLATNRYVDSLLREVSSERVGFQAFNLYTLQCCWVQEYFLRQDPEEYCVDIYPMRWVGNHFSGQAYQESLSYYPHWLNKCRIESQDEGKDLWVIMQTFVEGHR